MRTDVIVCVTSPFVPHDDPVWGTHPPAGDAPIDLGNDVSLERLDQQLAEEVMDAVRPAGLNYPHPARQFGQRYSFVRRIDTDVIPPMLAWDEGHHLWTALVLSKLIHETSDDAYYAASIIDRPTGTVIAPGEPLHPLFYRAGAGRPWLTEGEAYELRDLLAAYDANVGGLPDRARTALWTVVRSFQEQFLDEAVITLVSGLEALLKTERRQLTQQFKARVPALAQEFGIPIGEALAESLYDARSAAAHGARAELLSGNQGQPNPALADLEILQRLLREAVRRALEDQAFADIFGDDAKIEACWPV